MAYIVLNPIVSRLVDKLVGFANEELDLILGVPDEIPKLCRTLRSIQAVLNDAEQQQITLEAVKLWLSDLRDVMYDADDILDEYQIISKEWASREHPPEEPPVGCRMFSLCSCFQQAKFTHEIGSKLRDLNQRLNLITEERKKFNLKIGISIPNRQRVVPRLPQTTPGIEPDIVGEAIEKNIRDLVDLLTRKDEGANTKLVVLAILGLGGIGKTTMAQKIFNDDKIKIVFQKIIWVCVSQEFVETDLLKEIILRAGGTLGEASSKALLDDKVMNLLKDIKFFLVLDDVWDAKIWDDCLRKPLQVGAVGSRVLVTTRNKGVADRMKANHIHRVDALSSDDSWLLLCKKVTKNVEEERNVERLKDIGMRIVEKCQRLPLAITVIGGVLCGEFRRWKWEEVELSSIWSRTGLPEGIHQALYLSYADLPSHLKQCFLHCSLFREDSWLEREYLVQLWIAEGFVVEVEREEYPSLEEIGQGYLDELIQRSLLQDWGEGIYWTRAYKMHDLLRSLCHFLARGENLVITDISKRLPSAADDYSTKLRRLSIVAPEPRDIKPILPFTQRNKSVRTLMKHRLTQLDDKDVEDCFKNFKCLRVINLGNTKIQSLPHSAENLIHLRFLNLTDCEELRSLPESIANLQNLQFLVLEGCINLCTLPLGVVQLRNLRTLNVEFVPLKELPSGISRLEHLNVLKGAKVSLFSSHNSNNSRSSKSSCSLEEICQLRKLRELSIYLKISVRSNPNVNGLYISLTALKYLQVLNLYYLNDYSNDGINDSIFDVALHPPSCVRQIQMSYFLGHQFPQWLLSSSISLLLANLKELWIDRFESCVLLPPLGKLPSLEVLNLYHLLEVTNIGTGFFGYEEASTSDGLAHQNGGSKSALSSLVLFPCLKLLILHSLPNLEAWDWVPEVGGIVAMPQLNELKVNYCPKLSSLPEGLTRQATRLTSLFVHDTKINFFSGFPALEMLDVQVHDVGNLSLPNWLLHNRPHWTSLRRLILVYKNKSLLSNFLQDDPGWPAIREIPVVEIKDSHGNYIKHSSIFPTTFHTSLLEKKSQSSSSDGKVGMLDDKDVEDCLKIFQRLRVVRLSDTRIQSLPQSARNLLHLRYLNLSYFYRLKPLPESIANLQNLQYLFLGGCKNLHTLPKGVVQLCNLRILDLSYVPLKQSKLSW